MTTWVIRDGQLVDKSLLDVRHRQTSALPAPRVARFAGYDSPIDGAWISSDRQRERDLARSDSFDTRDLPKDHQWARGRQNQLREASDADRTGRQGSQAGGAWGQLDQLGTGKTAKPA